MTDPHGQIHGRLEALSLDDSTVDSSTSESEAETHSYVLINSRGRFEQFQERIRGLSEEPHVWQKPHVFLCCEGRDLGRGGGRLGLVQIGVKEDIYLLDVLTYGKNLEVLKQLLENEGIEKIMWDGRFAAAELWHDHEISIVAGMDIQLVHVQEKTGGRPIRGCLPADAMETAFLGLSSEILEATDLDLRAFNRRQEDIQRKQRNDRDFWLRRPMTISALDYSSFKIVQLRTLYTTYLDAISKYPHILVESQRYLDLYKDERPPANIWFLDHDVLQQEIVERPPQIHERYDAMGTRVCAGCRRALHQDSFRDSFARRWTLRLGEHGRLCYTCTEARRKSDARASSTRWDRQMTPIT